VAYLRGRRRFNEANTAAAVGGSATCQWQILCCFGGDDNEALIAQLLGRRKSASGSFSAVAGSYQTAAIKKGTALCKISKSFWTVATVL
jgi:hypothetical protein